MSDEKQQDWKAKALQFGKKAFEVGKVVAGEIGKGIDALEAKYKESQQLDQHDGSFVSAKPYPQLFEEISKQLSRPIGKHRFRVSTDRNNCTIDAFTSWTEYVSSAQPQAETALDLTLTFAPEQTGTVVSYQWMVRSDTLGGGVFDQQIIRIVNGWLKSIAESH